eukprot:scaffold321_cov95-Cylindrotheca_fusiformis.AAC.14
MRQTTTTTTTSSVNNRRRSNTANVYNYYVRCYQATPNVYYNYYKATRAVFPYEDFKVRQIAI